MTVRLWLPLAIGLILTAGTARTEEPASPPVAEVVDGRLAIGNTQLPVFVSQDWSQPLPGMRRAVIVVHGYNRDAANYARNVVAFGPPADTFVVAPQFLDPEDIATHHLPDTVLRWDREQWAEGDPALGPAPISAYDGFDAILIKLSDRALFPNLTQIVLAGFSAGGQFAQRYAAIGKAEAGFTRGGIAMRYVIGSPGSYVYFGDERPLPGGGFGPFAQAAQCPDYNHWRYGFAGGLPSYVASAAAAGVTALERRYVARDIVYLVGADDTNPNHRLLDKSCAGEAQGPTRLDRMRAFVADMQQRDPGMRHSMHVIAGAPHNEAKVFGSPCGRAALFGDENCPAN
jgi:pimeloyl-ACP methyl ester carboxylesterase